jgi:hypothetical protein
MSSGNATAITPMTMPAEWRAVMIAGLSVDCVGVIACTTMLLYILVYRCAPRPSLMHLLLPHTLTRMQLAVVEMTALVTAREAHCITTSTRCVAHVMQQQSHLCTHLSLRPPPPPHAHTHGMRIAHIIAHTTHQAISIHKGSNYRVHRHDVLGLHGSRVHPAAGACSGLLSGFSTHTPTT